MENSLTFVSSDGIHQSDFRIVFAHLLDYLASLKCQFIGWWHTQALRNEMGGGMLWSDKWVLLLKLSKIIIARQVWEGTNCHTDDQASHFRPSRPVREQKTNLGISIIWIDMTEHGQDKGSSFSSSRLWLSNQILRTKKETNKQHGIRLQSKQGRI